MRWGFGEISQNVKKELTKHDSKICYIQLIAVKLHLQQQLLDKNREQKPALKAWFLLKFKLSRI